MGLSKMVRTKINLSCTLWSVASNQLFNFMDFASLITCIWMVLMLIYFHFVKDFLEILAYSTFKYVNRFKWLYRILKSDNLLQHINDLLKTQKLNYSTGIENFLPKEKTQDNFPVNASVTNSIRKQFSRYDHECTPHSSKTKLDINPRYIDFTNEPRSENNSTSSKKSAIVVEEKPVLLCPKKSPVVCPDDNDAAFSHENSVAYPNDDDDAVFIKDNLISHPDNDDAGFSQDNSILHPVNDDAGFIQGNSIACPDDDAIFNPEENICNRTEYFYSNKNVISNPPRVLASSPKIIIKCAENQELNTVLASPDLESGCKQNFFSWNFNRIRDSFKKESKTKLFLTLTDTVKCNNKAEKFINIQPNGLESNEKLIITNDSPVNVGCCNSLFITFRSKLPVKENISRTVHYKRF